MTAKDAPSSDEANGPKRERGWRVVDFEGGVRGELFSGHVDGPEVWFWVPAGAKAPSMLQAAAVLRDRLDPAQLHGSVGFLLDGPLLRVGSVADPTLRRASLVGLGDATSSSSLLMSLVEAPGQQAQRIELDVDDSRARQIARGSGIALLVKAPRLHGIAPPVLTLIDGVESAHSAIDARVVSRSLIVFEALLTSLGMLRGNRPRVPLRVVIRRVVSVDRGDLGGTAQVTVEAGDVVRKGDVLALIGSPGLVRSPLLAPVSAVVLAVQRSTGSPVLLLGKVERALARLEARRKMPPERHRLVSGWSEWVSLPDLGIARIKAKLDTGARTCALHVRSIQFVDGAAEDPQLADIEIPTGRRGRHLTVRCVVVEFASVRDSGGHAERRPVIETSLVLGGVSRRVRVSLTDRGDMLFPMLVGRTALGSEFVVDPSTRFRFGNGK